MVFGNPGSPTLLTIMVTQPYGIQTTGFGTILTARMLPAANWLKLAGGRFMSHLSRRRHSTGLEFEINRGTDHLTHA